MTIAAKQCREYIEAKWPGTPISRFACRNTASGGISQHSAYGSPSSPIDSNALDIYGPGKTPNSSDQAYIQEIVEDLLAHQHEWSIRKILWRDGGAHENHAHVDFYPMIAMKKWCGGPETPTWRYSSGHSPQTIDTRDPEPENGRYGGPGMTDHPTPWNLGEYRKYHEVGNPPQWAVDAWNTYLDAGYSTVPESIGWPVSRFDLAWFRLKLIEELDERYGTVIDHRHEPGDVIEL